MSLMTCIPWCICTLLICNKIYVLDTRSSIINLTQFINLMESKETWDHLQVCSLPGHFVCQICLSCVFFSSLILFSKVCTETRTKMEMLVMVDRYGHTSHLFNTHKYQLLFGYTEDVLRTRKLFNTWVWWWVTYVCLPCQTLYCVYLIPHGSLWVMCGVPTSLTKNKSPATTWGRH